MMLFALGFVSRGALWRAWLEAARRGGLKDGRLKDQVRSNWQQAVLVCRKCSKKLDGGFGPDGDLTLKKALRKYLHLKKGKKGRKGALTVTSADCFDICPKGAVVAVNAAQPKKLLIIPAGADLFDDRATLLAQAYDARERAMRGEPQNPK